MVMGGLDGPAHAAEFFVGDDAGAPLVRLALVREHLSTSAVLSRSAAMRAVMCVAFMI